jgi:hypothetical protein
VQKIVQNTLAQQLNYVLLVHQQEHKLEQLVVEHAMAEVLVVQLICINILGRKWEIHVKLNVSMVH